MAIPAGANLVLNLRPDPALRPRTGALWSTAASYGVGAVGAAILGRRACPLPVPWTALAKSGLASGLMAVRSVLAVPGARRRCSN